MTNFEKYAEEIKKLLEEEGRTFAVNKKGRVQRCGGKCSECIFYGPRSCGYRRLKWLYEEAEQTREEAIKEITTEFLKICHDNQSCDECPYASMDSIIGCHTAFAYDYLKGGDKNDI